MQDKIIFDLIEKEKQRQSLGIELIASENYVSEQVLAAAGSILTNKYAEGLPAKRYYGGCQVVDQIENIAIERAKKLFGAAWANVQPHSGAQANMAIFYTCLTPGDKILGLSLAHGGHLTHGSGVNFSGKWYEPHFFHLKKEDETIDYEEIYQKALQEKPKLIIAGASAYALDWDYARVRQIADQVGALVWADIAHPAGLIATGLLNNAVKHCHIVSSTTHKTLRGPRGGLLLLGEDFENPWGRKNTKGDPLKMSQLLDAAVFPGIQGGPLEHIIAAKAIAFEEALQPSYKEYCQQIIKNTQVLGKTLQEKGYRLISGGTQNHLILVDMSSKKITGKAAESLLVSAHITTNKNMIPFDPLSPAITSGIRFGAAALTTRGLVEKDMVQIGNWIDEIIVSKENTSKINTIGNEIQKYMGQFPLFAK